MIAYALIIFGILMRLVPHMPNVVPVAAIALFAGTYLNKKIVPWVPLAIMIASDLIIGLHEMVIFTWGSFILIGYIGMYLKNRRSFGNIFAASVFSGVIFFLISNFGVWLIWYPQNLTGLSECFIAAIPFFRNMVFGNVLFSFMLFGLYELARNIAASSKYKTVLLTE